MALPLATAALLCLALARPATAQPPAGSPVSAEPAAPAAPALAPPPPVRLGPAGAATVPEAAQRAAPAAPLPGLEARPEGGWRLRFPPGSEAALPAGTPASLAELGRRLARQPAGRITVVAQVSGPASDVSVARRLSLARGLAVKEALAAGGLAETRIDIRPAGRTEDAIDAVDVLPPAVPRTSPR